MSNSVKREAIKDIFDSYEYAHNKLNADFMAFREKIEDEITLEDEHMSRLAELSQLISAHKLDEVKVHLATLGTQVQQYIGNYQEKVTANNKIIDAIYENNKQSLFEVCEIKRIVNDLDAEICRFLEYVDRDGPLHNEQLAHLASDIGDPKWQATDKMVLDFSPSANCAVNELRFTLWERPYALVRVKSGETEPSYVDQPRVGVAVDGYTARVKGVELVEVASDRFEMSVSIESTVLNAGGTHSIEVTSGCMCNVQMGKSGTEYAPSVKVLGCTL
jgi:hypothetical protein